jgi:hypothetical protein
MDSVYVLLWEKKGSPDSLIVGVFTDFEAARAAAVGNILRDGREIRYESWLGDVYWLETLCDDYTITQHLVTGSNAKRISTEGV